MRRWLLALSLTLLVLFAFAIAISFLDVTWTCTDDGFTYITRFRLSNWSLFWEHRGVSQIPKNVVSSPSFTPPSPRDWFLISFFERWHVPFDYPGPADLTMVVSGWRIPLWPELVLCLIYPGYVLVCHYRQRSRSKKGCCQNCGYSLTGNTSGVCPECGEKI